MGLMSPIFDKSESYSPAQKFAILFIGILSMFVLPDAAIHVFVLVACYVLLYGNFGMQPDANTLLAPSPKVDKLGCAVAQTITGVEKPQNSPVLIVGSFEEELGSEEEEDRDFCESPHKGELLKPALASTEVPCFCPPSSYAEGVLALSKFVVKARQEGLGVSGPNGVELSQLASRTDEQVQIIHLMKWLQVHRGPQAINLEHLDSELLPRICGIQQKISAVTQAAEDMSRPLAGCTDPLETPGPPEAPAIPSELMLKLSQFVNMTRECHATDCVDLQGCATKVNEQADLLHTLKMLHKHHVRAGQDGLSGLGNFIAKLEPRILTSQMKIAAAQPNIHVAAQTTPNQVNTPPLMHSGVSPPPGLPPLEMPVEVSPEKCLRAVSQKTHQRISFAVNQQNAAHPKNFAQTEILPPRSLTNTRFR